MARRAGAGLDAMAGRRLTNQAGRTRGKGGRAAGRQRMPGPGSCLTGRMQRVATQRRGKAGQASVVLTLHAGEVRGGGQSGQGQGCMGARPMRWAQTWVVGPGRSACSTPLRLDLNHSARRQSTMPNEGVARFSSVAHVSPGGCSRVRGQSPAEQGAGSGRTSSGVR